MNKLVNNWEFAKQLDIFKSHELDKLIKQVQDAKKIVDDKAYPWADDSTKKVSLIKYDQMQRRLAIMQSFHDEGTELVKQHEELVFLLSKLYDRWYNDISNDGKQETELMESQADIINDIFTELYNILKPLDLEEMKPPKKENKL